MNETLKAESRPSFWSDLTACWHLLPNKAFFFTLLAAWLALFHFYGNSILGYVKSPSLFVWLYGDLNNQNPAADDGLGHWIPFLVLGLFWWKRKTLLALPAQLWWPGLLVLAAGGLAHLVGFLTQQPRFSVIGLFIGIFGLMGLTWGRAWLKESFFPFWLFIFAVPLAAVILPLTFKLRILSAGLTSVLANALTISVVRTGTQLASADGAFQYDVAAACSGIRSLMAIFLLATIYGYMTFRSPWKRVILMALALPLSVVGNCARLMCIILAAELGGQSAGNYVHESAFFSLVPYVPAIIGLILAGKWLEKKPPATPEEETP